MFWWRQLKLKYNSSVVRRGGDDRSKLVGRWNPGCFEQIPFSWPVPVVSSSQSPSTIRDRLVRGGFAVKHLKVPHAHAPHHKWQRMELSGDLLKSLSAVQRGSSCHFGTADESPFYRSADCGTSCLQEAEVRPIREKKIISAEERCSEYFGRQQGSI
jgi:hypothetical protein